MLKRAARWLALALVLVALALAVRGLARRNTWYLASDQFAFLTFGADLREGRIFHDPAPLLLLAGQAPPRGDPSDAFFQTYVWTHDHLFCRYPPGFPALLAGAMAIGGEDAAHVVNPVLYVGLLLLAGGMAALLIRRETSGSEISREAWGPAAGASAIWLVLLLPTTVHLWGVTVARDLAAHLLGFVSLALAIVNRWSASGLALGVALTVRPDAALYGASLGALALVRGVPRPALLRALLATIVGALPLFAYNWLTGGSPLAFTQGNEFQFLTRLAGLWSADEARAAGPVWGSRRVSGGGFQLRNFARTFPANLDHLTSAFGSFSLFALGGIGWSLRRRREAAAVLAPYAVLAILFYSFWGHADARYLAGAMLAMIVLAALGVSAGTAWILRTDGRPSARAVLAIVAAVMAMVWLWAGQRVDTPPTLLWAEWAVVGAIAALGLVALVRTHVSPAAAEYAAVLPVALLAAVGVYRVATGSGARDPFPREQVARAVDIVRRTAPPGSLLVTSGTLGRPAENLTHYADLVALYADELQRLRVPLADATVRFLRVGRRAFVLSRREDHGLIGELPDALQARIVADASGDALLDWFVDPQKAPFGAVLTEISLSDGVLAGMRAAAEAMAGPPAPGRDPRQALERALADLPAESSEPAPAP